MDKARDLRREFRNTRCHAGLAREGLSRFSICSYRTLIIHYIIFFLSLKPERLRGVASR